MPGKVNPTQAESADDDCRTGNGERCGRRFLAGAGGYLEMNVYKPLIIFNITHSITIMTDGCTNFPQVPGRGYEAKSEKDQGVCGSLADARDGAGAGHWLR